MARHAAFSNLSQPVALLGRLDTHIGSWRGLGTLFGRLFSRYRPEKTYMRGAGTERT